MIVNFFKVPAGEVPTVRITMNTRMGALDEYKIVIESAPAEAEPEHDDLCSDLHGQSVPCIIR